MTAEDGDFKKGRFSPVMVGVGALILVGAGTAIALGLKSNEEKMTVDQIAAVKKGIYVMPRAEQLPRWEKLATEGSFELKQEALQQLVFLNDKQVVGLATTALTNVDHRVRGTAAQAISAVGLPDAEPARAAVLKAYKEADSSDRPQLAWTAVVLGEKSLFNEVMDVYKAGHLAGVQRISGGRAFDVETFAKMASVDEWEKQAGDANESVRQLVAGILSKNADKKYTATLIKLVNDPKNGVAREAASGLGKIGDPAAMKPLIDALSRADKDDRQSFLEALRDGIGGEGLVLALAASAKDPPERNKFQNKQVFDILRLLQDPRSANQLVVFLQSKPKPHWMTEAAQRLAEVGDLRAVPYLADRLKMDPLKIYDQTTDPEYRRDDNERVVSARMLADLAALHPEASADILAKAEDAAMQWATEKPQPHANALRFLVTAGSKKVMPKLREWASPKDPLPKAGESGGFPMSYETAQSALRYLGWTKEEASWSILEKQLTRKEAKWDITQDGLIGQGLTMLGMVLRGLAVGAAQGFSQWGDKRAFPLLMKLAEDEKHNEGAREQACMAMAWVATEDNLKEVVNKAKAASGTDPKKQYLRACLMETLIRHPVPSAMPDLLSMLTKDQDPAVRRQVARAIGWGGIDKPTEASLLGKVGDQDLRNDAALALLLGGSEEGAARAIAMFADAPKEALDSLKEDYFNSFGYWSDEDLAKGRIYRWVANAQAVGRIRVHDTTQDWAALRLGAQFNNLEYDSGPRSMTRVVLRSRLIDIAKKGDADAKKGSIETLKFMKEQGVLMALKEEKGDTGALAKVALFELLNPKSVIGETVPEAKKAAPEGMKVIPPK